MMIAIKEQPQEIVSQALINQRIVFYRPANVKRPKVPLVPVDPCRSLDFESVESVNRRQIARFQHHPGPKEKDGAFQNEGIPYEFLGISL